MMEEEVNLGTPSFHYKNKSKGGNYNGEKKNAVESR